MKAEIEEFGKQLPPQRQGRAPRLGLLAGGAGLALCLLLWWLRPAPSAQPGSGFKPAQEAPPHSPASDGEANATPGEAAAPRPAHELLSQAPASTTLVRLQGVVLDEEGRALVGAHMVFCPPANESLAEHGEGHTVDTDDEGRFQLDLQGGVRYQLRVTHVLEPGLHLQQEIESCGEPITLLWDRRLLRRVMISGRVLDGPGGAALKTFQAWVLPQDPQGEVLPEHELKVQEASGDFHIAGLAPGRYRLRFSSHGFLDAELDLGHLEEGAHRFEIGLERLHLLRLQLADGAGAMVLPEALEVRDEVGRLLYEFPNADEIAHVLQTEVVLGLSLPARSLEVVLELEGRQLRYSLAPDEVLSGTKSLIVDFLAHESRESVRVLVCTIAADSTLCDPGWFDELTLPQREALREGAELAPFAKSKLELELRDRNCAWIGYGGLARQPPSGWLSSLRLAGGPRVIEEQSDHPRLLLELPRRGFQMSVQAEGCERLELAANQLRPADLDSTRLLVLRRLP